MHNTNFQGASSLFMYNGTNDTYQRGMPLRIKDGAGLDVFTEWQSISDSLEQNDVASFEDDQPNSLSFTQPNIYKSITTHYFDDSLFDFLDPSTPIIEKPLDPIDDFNPNIKVAYIPEGFIARDRDKLSFNDTWKANKIKVYDNLAFVCYEDYTDLEKIEVDITDPLGLSQYYLSRNTEIAYSETINEQQWIGTLSFGDRGFGVSNVNPINYYVGEDYTDFRSESDSPKPDRALALGEDFTFIDFHNCILKVEFDDDAYNYSNQTLYFHYGGALPNSLMVADGIKDFHLNNTHLKWDLDNPDEISERDLDYSSRLLDAKKNLGNFVPGYSNRDIFKRWFYIVPQITPVNFAVPQGPVLPYDTNYPYDARIGRGSVRIQLDLQLKVAIRDTSELTYVKTGTDNNGSQYNIYSKRVPVKKITLIQFNPIRKCGKVDVYTKKTGFVSAISGNTITSNNHNLKTGDVVEFSSVLFDIGHTGASDAHPMNGLKHVKVLTDNTFEIYDEEYFLNPSSTNNIRTLDGIKWIYHSNKLGEDHSWEYYKTLFSPTGKNGYGRNTNFIDSRRFTSLDSSNSDSTNNGLSLDFTDPNIIPSLLDENIPTSAGGIKKGFYRYYPYYCQDKQDVTEPDKNSYWGSKFGCDLDIDFSHMSGDSKIYTLAIGERGSDISVDLLGITGTEDIANTINQNRNIDSANTASGIKRFMTLSSSSRLWNIAPPKIYPEYLPHGKTHLLTVTVDSTGSISDISWKNTLYGGGGAITQSSEFSSYSENNPWISPPFGITEELNYKEYFNFVENLRIIEDQYNSNYWIRSAVAHWYPNSIHDYNVKTNQERDTKYLRAIDSARHPRPILSVDTDSFNNRSRFGSVGFGGDDFTPFERIDRYGKSSGIEDDYYNPINDELLYAAETDARWIYPWVDSFGKSVAIKNLKGLTSISGYTDDDIKTVVLSASTTRSNIEYNNTNNLELITSLKINESDTVSEIGQIQANFVYSDGTDYTSMDWMYLNSGGADCDRLFNNLTVKNSQRGLKTGSLAGYGMKEVLTSCALSASRIQWYKDQIIWVDQELYSNKATVNVLKFNDGFEKDFTFSVNYIDSRDSAPLTLPTARNTGDGFGIDFKYEDNIFVTNSRSKTTELDYNISDHLSDRDRIDYVQIYENLKDGFNLTQKISPTVDKTNTKYNNLHNYDLFYVPGSVSYEGDSVNNLTWDIDFSGRYDLFDGKILIKDPLQYSLFGRDFSVSSFEQDDSISQEQAEMYMAINERVRVSNKRSLNSLQYEYISADDFEYACRDVGGAKNSSVSTKTPFFFFKLPIENLDVVEDIEITFDMIAEDIYSYFDIKGQTNLADQTNNIIPRIVLYAKDPRSMIIENGPADSGTNLTSFPKYENGIWKEFADIDSGGEHFSYQFPGWYRGGAQDLFFYGSVPGEDIETRIARTTPQKIEFLFGGEKNLGEYYDLTAGTRLGGNAGDPVWIAPDYRGWRYSSYASRVKPYAKLFMPTASQDGYSVKISRSELKDFIITNNLIKDEDRPTSVVSGFNDSANKYNVENIEYSIIVGLVLTNLESFDISTGTSTHEEPSSSFSLGPLRHISDNQSSQDYVNARYPYSNVVGFYDPSSEGNKYNGSYLEYDLRTTVKSLNVILSKRRGSNQRYNNKFHKIANIDYENKYVGANPDAFVPDQNPIISIGKKSSGFDLNENYEVLNSENISNTSTKSTLLGGLNLNKDQYLSLNIEAVASEDIYSDLFVGGVGYASGNPVLFTGGVDGKNNNFNLYIRNGERTDNANINLFLKSKIKNRELSLFTYEVAPSSNMPLYTPTQDDVSDITLTMNNPFKTNTTLNIKAPIEFNSSIPLVRVPQVSGSFPVFIDAIGKINNKPTLFTEAVIWEPADMTLAFSPGVSGNIPLFLARNLEQNKDMTLVMPEVYGVSSGVTPLWIARNGKEDDTSLFIKPPFPYNEDTELFINSQIENNSDTTLTTVSQIVFGDSTLSDKTYTSLFMPNDFPSGEMPLYQSPIGYHNSGVSLIIGRSFKDNETFLRVGQGSEIGSPLFIDGHALPYNKNSTLFLQAQNVTSNVDLFINGVVSDATQADLNIAGSLQASDTAGIPLFAGKEIYAQDDTSLYINNDNTAVSVGSTGQINELTVAISGGLSAPLKQDGPLFIQVPPFVSGVQQAPLYLSVDEPVYGPGGGILSSGSQEFFIEGNNDAGVWYKNNNNTTLNITSTYPSSGDATLYIDRPLEAGVSLIIPSLIASGDMNVYISGANIGSGVMELYISPPQAKSLDLFTRGYLE